MFEERDNFIPGIFNYCDRWCEHCAMTARCRVYMMQREYTGEQQDLTQTAFWRNLQNIFTETKEILRGAAAARGIDIDALDLEEAGEIIERRQLAIKQQDLTKLAEKYAGKVNIFLAAQDLSDKTIEQNRLEMLQIISWYHFFIAAKINRALYAEDDFAEGTEDDVLENGSDGSMKIALIAIDRSIGAWKILLLDEIDLEIESLIKLLETLRRLCEEKFPNARDFLRPGFDEIETVM